MMHPDVEIGMSRLVHDGWEVESVFREGAVYMAQCFREYGEIREDSIEYVCDVPLTRPTAAAAREAAREAKIRNRVREHIFDIM